PIVIHATRTGFFKSAASSEYSDPGHWRPLLQARPELRISFAHCGGWAGLSDQDPVQREWSERIFRLMDEFPHVYADVAYHVEMMGGGEPEERYIAALTA